MLRQILLSIVFAATLITATALPVLADCKDEIQEVRDDLDKNKDDYTREAIAKARKHLLEAELPSLKPADCRRELLAAKKELRRGKR